MCGLATLSDFCSSYIKSSCVRPFGLSRFADRLEAAPAADALAAEATELSLRSDPDGVLVLAMAT